MSVSAGCCGSFRVTKRMSLLGKGLCLVAFFKDIRRHCMSLIGSWPLSSEKDLTFVTRRLNKFRWETCVSVAYKNMILVLFFFFYNLKDTTYSSCYLWCSLCWISQWQARLYTQKLAHSSQTAELLQCNYWMQHFWTQWSSVCYY